MILDQRRLAGVGNIYADEALWRAPDPPPRLLGEDELRALHPGIRAALNAGIARQGATLRDYGPTEAPDIRSTSSRSTAAKASRASDAGGESRIRAAGRGTWFCPAVHWHRVPSQLVAEAPLLL